MLKRVLHIVPSLELGGTEAYIMNNYRNIDREKLQFDFLVFDKKTYPYLNEITALGGRVFYGVVPSLKNTLHFLRIFKKIIKDNGPYQAVHCHANAGNAIPLLCSAICGVKKRLSHSHADQCFSNRFFGIIKIFRRAIINIFATEYLACSYRAGVALYGERLFSKKGSICKNGIEVEKFIRSNEQKNIELMNEFNIDNDDFVVGNITRFDKNKNQFFAVNVFENLLKYFPNAVLILGGVDGGCLNEIKNLVRDKGLEKRVRFIGSRKNIENCLRLIDVYLFPSYHEGLGIALLEAQAAGCLCFASDGVPKEADMGLGTVEYYDLQDGAAKWADRMLAKIDTFIPPDEAEILSAFQNKGYDIRESASKLVKDYEGK